MSWQNFADTHCGSSNLSLTDGGSFFVDALPGLLVFGPNFEDLLGRLKVAAGNLFRARGETVTNIEIITVESGEVAMELWMAPAEKAGVSFAPRNVSLHNNCN